MKTISAIAATAILGATTMARALDKHPGGTQDKYVSVLTDRSRGDPTGEPLKGKGDLYGSHLANQDMAANSGIRPERLSEKETPHDQDPGGHGTPQFD